MMMKKNVNIARAVVMGLDAHIVQRRNTDMELVRTSVAGVVQLVLEQDAHIVQLKSMKNRKIFKPYFRIFLV